MESQDVSWLAVCVAVGLAGFAFAMIARVGWFTERAFERSPRRQTGLTAMDLPIGVLVLLTSGLAAGVMVRWFFPNVVFEADADQPVDDRMALSLLCAQVLAQGPVVVFALIQAARAQRGVARLGLALRCMPATIPWAIGAFVLVLIWFYAIGVVTYAIAQWLGTPLPQIAHDLLDALVHTPSAWAKWTMVASAVLVAPLLEEIIYRGLAQTALLDLFGRGRRWLVILVTSVLFVSVHLSAIHPVALGGLFMLSMVLGWLYERTGSLWPCIAVHMLFNGANVLFATSGVSAPPS